MTKKQTKNNIPKEVQEFLDDIFEDTFENEE
jgi:hypothetical protein